MEPEPPNRALARRRFLVRGGLLAVAGLIGAGLLAVVATFPPAEYSFYPQCLSYRLTGLHCPGCGLTRAAHSTLNLEFAQALAYNPLAVVILPYLAVAVLRSAWLWLWDVEPRTNMFPAWLGWTIVGVMVAFWVLRNVPAYPFTLLAPHVLS